MRDVHCKEQCNLNNIVVILDDKSQCVIDYMSGKNEDTFFTAVVNGMWQLKQSKLAKNRKSNDTGKFYCSYCGTKLKVILTSIMLLLMMLYR